MSDSEARIRQLEARIAELEARLSDATIIDTLVEKSQDQLVYLDREFNFVRVNRAYAETCQRSPEEFIGHNHFEFYPHAENQAIFEHVRDTGEPAVFREKPFVFPDQPERGTTYWDWTLTPVKDSAGLVTGLVFSLRDVTPEVRARHWIEESEQRFRVMADGAPTIIWVTDGEGRLQFANRHYREFFGVTSEQVEARKWLPPLHPEDAEQYVETFLAAIRERKPFRREVRGRRADGEWRWIAIRAEPRLSPDGEFLGHVGIGTDITERKRTEEALQESEANFRSLFEHQLDAYGYCRMLFDERRRPVDFLCLEVNPAFARVTGLDGVVGKWVTEVIPGIRQSQPDLFEILGRTASTGQPQRFELHFKPLAMWLDFSVFSPRKDHFVAVFDNITERKTAEQEREKLVEALRETDRRKNEFMAVLSHELRNPLAPIKNSLFILDHAAPGGDQARRAQIVLNRQVDQLARLVDDLLDVTRISRNKIQLQRQRLELNELVRRTIEDHRSVFEKAEIHVELVPAPQPVFVNADWNRLGQVIGNLLHNAAKFTGRGGRVRAAVATDPGAHKAVIAFADTGVGMSPEMLQRLFQPFMQADTTLDRNKGGLGLGLALVKGLVELHGGDVKASSEGLGQGTEVVIRLPLELQGPEPRPGRASPPSLPRRVLIIEDNIDAADSLREALEFGDHEVEVAYDGPQGIAMARASRPEVVLCDIGLPGMNGYEVARAIRADELLRSVHLVALSGYALPEDLARAQEAGFDRHLAKPPILEKLQELLESLPPPDPRRTSGVGRMDDSKTAAGHS